jgi:AraC-like DNA-binding protein
MRTRRPTVARPLAEAHVLHGRTDQLIEEVQRLFNSGEPIRSIAHRLGYQRPASLGRRLLRHDQHDLGRLFYRQEAS